MNVKSKIMAGVIALAFAGTANAGLIGVTGDGAIISAPGSVAIGGAKCTDWPGQSCEMLGFDEQQGVTLGSALSVDGGTIAAGTTVNSHMIFLNTPGSQRNQSTATWQFDGVILGVMSDNGGLLEAASNGLLGALATTYPGSFNNRGFEANNPDTYSGVGTSSLEVTMLVTQPGDWIRVVTATSVSVPEPAALFLLGTGLLGLFGRRKRSA